jgi:hypothetical protein
MSRGIGFRILVRRRYLFLSRPAAPSKNGVIQARPSWGVVSHDDKLILQTEILPLLARIFFVGNGAPPAPRWPAVPLLQRPQGWDRSACRLTVIRRIGPFLPLDPQGWERAADITGASADLDRRATQCGGSGDD